MMPDISIDRLFSKLKEIKGVEELLEKAALLYVLLTDGDISYAFKAVIIAALLYLIDPIDAVPDIIPFVGLLDDLAVITAALKMLTEQTQSHHLTQASSIINEL